MEFQEPTELTTNETLVAELWRLYHGFAEYLSEEVQHGDSDDGLVAAWERLEDEISPRLQKKVGIDRIHAFVLQGYGTWDEIWQDHLDTWLEDAEDED